VKDPTDGVVDKLRFRESLMASFMGYNLMNRSISPTKPTNVVRGSPTQRPVAKRPVQKL
jgi:hypothetical protein